jgi:hypothetical protein
MDLNHLLHRHQLSLMAADHSLSAREQLAHAQFAREFSDEIARRREVLGAGRALPGYVT